jgi:predicted dehydrogenase
MKRRSVGLEGCGIWGKLVLRDLVTLGADVFVAEIDPTARIAARIAGAGGVFGDAHELPPVDGIIVATPAVTHAEIVTPLLARKVPMLVEKPFTTKTADADRLVEAGGDLLYVGHTWRYHPGVQLLGEIARSGEIGSVPWPAFEVCGRTGQARGPTLTASGILPLTI